ncbi:MAG: hypothetical protein M1839_009266 [Geoglossum umbratile]|nr:MAG: hypothetical protein M1839_009266 [Geoglossum umbratile]
MISVFDYVVVLCDLWDMDRRNIAEGPVETASPEQQLHNSPLMLSVGTSLLKRGEQAWKSGQFPDGVIDQENEVPCGLEAWLAQCAADVRQDYAPTSPEYSIAPSAENQDAQVTHLTSSTHNSLRSLETLEEPALAGCSGVHRDAFCDGSFLFNLAGRRMAKWARRVHDAGMGKACWEGCSADLDPAMSADCRLGQRTVY